MDHIYFIDIFKIIQAAFGFEII